MTFPNRRAVLGVAGALTLSSCAGGRGLLRPSRGWNGLVQPIVEREIAAGHVPGAVVSIGQGGRRVFERAYGLKSVEPVRAPLDTAAVFDFASLTKVVATTPSVMALIEDGALSLDEPAARWWPAFGAGGKGAITVRQLMTHVSGLAPDLDLTAPWSGEAEGLALAAASQPVRPPGEAFVYSDINFIVLAELLRRVSGLGVDAFAARRLFAPLRMRDTLFRPSGAILQRVVPTARFEGRILLGEVHDPTARRMGGVAGHAGLFSSAADLERYARMLLNGGALDGVRVLRPETVALMTGPNVLPGGVKRALGWDVSSGYSSGYDKAFSASSFGHTGYTGTMVWIDPASRSWVISLTSRLHPDSQGDAKFLRRDLGQAVGAAIREQG
ncbi:MAG: beta-lactamase family protein [Proteobacteria bacterium]|nr:beta-lactamase family protein [Pseudomonadota bacterium]